MNAHSPVEKFRKDLALTRVWLNSSGYFTAAKALEFALQFHTGTRKDGITPEFAHQLFLVEYLRTILPSVIHKEDTIVATLLHDVCEDYDISFEEISNRFGEGAGQAVRLLTKKHRGTKLSMDTYFEGMTNDPRASLIKLIDRSHNIFTMHGAGWTPEKQASYLDEIDRWFIPMLKKARRLFPEQEQAYRNVRTLLEVQATHIRLNLAQSATLNADQEAEDTLEPVRTP